MRQILFSFLHGSNEQECTFTLLV